MAIELLRALAGTMALAVGVLVFLPIGLLLTVEIIHAAEKARK